MNRNSLLHTHICCLVCGLLSLLAVRYIVVSLSCFVFFTKRPYALFRLIEFVKSTTERLSFFIILSKRFAAHQVGVLFVKVFKDVADTCVVG